MWFVSGVVNIIFKYQIKYRNGSVYKEMIMERPIKHVLQIKYKLHRRQIKSVPVWRSLRSDVGQPRNKVLLHRQNLPFKLSYFSLLAGSPQFVDSLWRCEGKSDGRSRPINMKAGPCHDKIFSGCRSWINVSSPAMRGASAERQTREEKNGSNTIKVYGRRYLRVPLCCQEGALLYLLSI